jgi:O-antigen biosynthesis protein
VFSPVEKVPLNLSEPLRVLVEGSPSAWFKHVHEAIDAVNCMHEPHHLTVVCGDRSGLGEVRGAEVVGPLSHRDMADLYTRTDVLLKLSSVEGMFGPPLEGFHRGATCVTTPVTGHEEYVEHGWNGLITDWDDELGTARALDLLARERDTLHFLRLNALETARSWPSWAQSSQFMAAALSSIRSSPPASAAASSARLLADLREGLETYDAHLRERADFARRALRFDPVITRVRDSAALKRVLALRRYRLARLAAKPLAPLTRRARRLLS